MAGMYDYDDEFTSERWAERGSRIFSFLEAGLISHMRSITLFFGWHYFHNSTHLYEA
jgi:hypothetical protein